MKRLGTWIATGAVLLLGTQSMAAQDESHGKALEEDKLQAAYEEALRSAEQERETALQAVERARVEMQELAEEQARRERKAMEARARHNEEESLARTEREAEIARMREELSRAHEELRRASREVARMHRELEMPHHGDLLAGSGLVNLGDKAVIGVILGESDEAGVRVLGVSPDGPAERAGVEQGDVIVAIEGKELAHGEDDDSATGVLLEVLEGIKIGDEILVTVDRDGETLDYTVTAERREPFGWASMLRLGAIPEVPDVPGAPVIVERIKIPEIDSAALAEQMKKIREDLDRTRIVLEARRADGFTELDENWRFDFEHLSELGEEAMLGANVWFGMPLTRGLKLSEIDAGLGEYFKTERGVLVLRARDDNELQLLSGDVILDVGGTEVDRPADVMRALRMLEPGSDLRINIMRNRKSESIEIVVPERSESFGYAPDFDHDHEYYFQFETD